MAKMVMKYTRGYNRVFGCGRGDQCIAETLLVMYGPISTPALDQVAR
jgi:hypothetical protein